MQNSDKRNSSRRSSEDRDTHTYNRKERTPPLPGWLLTVIIGLVEGLIAVAAPIGIVYANASLFREGARLGENMPTQVAGLISLWGVIGFVCSVLIIFFLAIIAAPIYVTRKRGLMTGMLAGGIVYLGIFFAHYFPGYPDIISSSAKTNTTGTWLAGAFTFIIFLTVYAAIGGVVSMWGRALGLWLRRGSRK